MEPVWDPAKAAGNLVKHGVHFSDAVDVLSDSAAITIEDTRFEEQRFVTIGIDFTGIITVVVYAYAEDDEYIRIISARRATGGERRQYEKANE